MGMIASRAPEIESNLRPETLQAVMLVLEVLLMMNIQPVVSIEDYQLCISFVE